MRIGFIGAGNMVSAIVRGAVAAGTPAGHLLLTSKHGSAERLAGQVGAVHVADAAELVSRSDILILGLKPYVIPDVLPRLSEAIACSRPLVVSIAAGLTLERLESMLPDGTRVVRTMPNMAAAVGESMTALAPGSSASTQDLETVRTLMETIGGTVILEERDFSSFIGLAGSSPALVCAFIDALARAGVMGGIPKALAVQIVAQAVLGTARTVQTEAQRTAEAGNGRTPADLIDAVCSPGGTSVAGMVALERAGFSDAVVRAFEAIAERDRELGA